MRPATAAERRGASVHGPSPCRRFGLRVVPAAAAAAAAVAAVVAAVVAVVVAVVVVVFVAVTLD